MCGSLHRFDNLDFALQKLALAIHGLFSAEKIENFIRKVLMFFTYLHKTDCGYTLQPPRGGSFNLYQQSMFWIKES